MGRLIKIDRDVETIWRLENVYVDIRPDGTKVFDGEFECKTPLTAVKRFCKLVPELGDLYRDAKQYGVFGDDSPFNVAGYGVLSLDFDSASIEEFSGSWYIAVILHG